MGARSGMSFHDPGGLGEGKCLEQTGPSLV